MSEANTTTDHDEIRRWVEERKGRPTVVEGTEGKDGEGILRIDFREPDDKLEEIPWGRVLQDVRRPQARLPPPGQDEGRQAEPVQQVRQAGRLIVSLSLGRGPG